MTKQMTKKELLAKLDKFDDDTIIKICNVFDAQVSSFGDVTDIEEVEDYTNNSYEPHVLLT